MIENLKQWSASRLVSEAKKAARISQLFIDMWQIDCPEQTTLDGEPLTPDLGRKRGFDPR